jgi:lipopolysaccharide transport system permease protein
MWGREIQQIERLPRTAEEPPAAALSAPAETQHHIRVVPRRGWVDVDWGEFFRHRSLLLGFARREVTVIYKEAVVGVAWVLLQPLATMLIFTILFGRIAKMPSQGIPYALFVLSGLVPWQYFNRVVTAGSNCLLAHKHILTKIYFPRLILPAAPVVAGAVDLAVALTLLVVVTLCFGIVPGPQVLWLPLFLVEAAAFSLGIVLWTSAANALFRDVGIALPFLLQVAMFATPVVYPADLVPARWEWVLRINPMAEVIDGLRWSLLSIGAGPTVESQGVTLAVIVLLLLGGAATFRRLEGIFVDRV